MAMFLLLLQHKTTNTQMKRLTQEHNLIHQIQNKQNKNIPVQIAQILVLVVPTSMFSYLLLKKIGQECVYK